MRAERARLYFRPYPKIKCYPTPPQSDEVSLAEHMDFLGKFPNLEELYTQGNQLTDVTFAGNLPLLKKLDITDNYVTDLRPLEKLSNLETVWCGENSISQGGNLAEGITVIFDSEAEEDVW